MVRQSPTRITLPHVFALREGNMEQYGDIGKIVEQHGTHLLFIPSTTPPLEPRKKLSIQQGLGIIAKPPLNFGHTRATERYANLRQGIDTLQTKSAITKTTANSLMYLLGFEPPKKVPSHDSLQVMRRDVKKRLDEQKGTEIAGENEKIAFLVGHFSLNEVVRYEMDQPENDTVASPYSVRRHGIGLGRVLEPFSMNDQVRLCAAIGFTLVNLYNQAQR